MSWIISLYGMTEQQKWLAQQLWLCDGWDEVREFRDSIDPEMWPDAQLVMECLILADMDNAINDETDCEEAVTILERIQNELDA